MSYEREIELLESEWIPDEGSFWSIREGRFDPAEFLRALHKIATLSIPEDDLPRRVVALLWYIPLVMQWQVERIQKNGGDIAAYTDASTTMTNEITRLLGVP